jgi:hypothetical protein
VDTREVFADYDRAQRIESEPAVNGWRYPPSWRTNSKLRSKGCLEEAKLIYQSANRTEAIQRFRQWKRRWQGQAAKSGGLFGK